VFLNRRVATQQRVVKDFQRVVELLPKNSINKIIALIKKNLSSKMKVHENVWIHKPFKNILLEGGKTGLNRLQNRDTFLLRPKIMCYGEKRIS